MTKQEYQKFVKASSPKSPIIKNCIMSFIFGGAICVIGQSVRDLLSAFTLLEGDILSGAVCIIMIFLGAVLTALGVYDKIARHAGAGTIVPITGFANSIVSSAMEFKSEGFICGMAVKMFTIAGPVIVFGTVFSVLAGIIFYVFGI